MLDVRCSSSIESCFRFQVRTADALEEALAFANAAGCAVAVTPDAKGMYPEQEVSGFIGTLWAGASSPCVQETMDAADLQILVGAWLTDCTTVGFSTLVKVCMPTDN